MSQRDDWPPAAASVPAAQPGRPDRAGAPGRPGHDAKWWLPPLAVLGLALVGSAVTWAISAVPLGLWETQGCFGNDAVPGTRCPSGHYLEVGLRLYVIPAALWAGSWLLPHQLRWRGVRIALLVLAVMTVTAIPLIATYLAFDHMYTIGGI
jgi:hypothetical protein